MLTLPKWNNLLWSSHTFKESDYILGWLPSVQLLADVPDNLTINVPDGELA